MNDLTNTPSIEKIFQLEHEMRKFDDSEIITKELDESINHYFAKGLYVRELFIPKGTLFTGKIHKTEHINIIPKGDITVWTESGMQRLNGPHIFVSQPGTKRVGLAHEDTIWVNIHHTFETDLSKIELDLIQDEKLYLELKELCLS